MKILLIGQTTLHWGRMEFGNIGNYYIIEPIVRELHKTFGERLTINTTLQMSKEFCSRENVKVLPMNYYYEWNENYLTLALEELSIATIYNKTGTIIKETPFIKEVLSSDLVIDFSGDIWGDNADLLGEDRFLIGLCKDRVAQLLNVPTVMIAGSPGPFNKKEMLPFIKEVYENFEIVTNRESISTELLNKEGFDLTNTKSLACPAFLFEPTEGIEKQKLLQKVGLTERKRPTVGFILCGWNFENGPFDKWPREDSNYFVFAEAIEFMVSKFDVDICLMSHSNGFPIPPKKFELIYGRDYPVIKQLQKILRERKNIAEDRFFTLDGVYNAWDTKAIISSFDMLVSGRIHAAVAGLSQIVPTVIIDYGHEPKAHKLRGFADVAGVLENVADPTNLEELINKITKCWLGRKQIKNNLTERIKTVKEKARDNFSLLAEVVK
ncbi:MAG: polysaccharide pyruvyl transferase family protein [Melioribacteraceae bacterium]